MGNTDSAYRSVPLTKALVPVIRKRLAEIGPDADADTLLLHTRNLTPWSLTRMQRSLSQVKVATGILFFFNSLRKGGATHLARAHSDEDAALLLGHADGDVSTLRTHQEEAATVIDPSMADLMGELLPDLDVA